MKSYLVTKAMSDALGLIENKDEQLRFENNLMHSACCLALSQDLESKEGLNYLLLKTKELGSDLARYISIKATMLLAIAKNEMQLWEQAKNKDATIFLEYSEALAKDERFLKAPFMKKLSTNCKIEPASDQQSLSKPIFANFDKTLYEISSGNMAKLTKLPSVPSADVGETAVLSSQEEEVEKEDRDLIDFTEIIWPNVPAAAPPTAIKM